MVSRKEVYSMVFAFQGIHINPNYQLFGIEMGMERENERER